MKTNITKLKCGGELRDGRSIGMGVRIENQPFRFVSINLDIRSKIYINNLLDWIFYEDIDRYKKELEIVFEAIEEIREILNEKQ